MNNFETLLNYLYMHHKNNPELRFGQMLNNLGVVSDTRLFYEPTKDTLDVIKNKLSNEEND